jgi:arylsulfatase A-like enzyme
VVGKGEEFSRGIVWSVKVICRFLIQLISHMLQRGHILICQLGINLKPWLCFVVYLWALEFQAAYGSGYETFFDRFTSASPLLWTLIVWGGLFAAVVTLGCLFFSVSLVRRINEFLCRTACFIVTGYFLKRWLDHWDLDALHSQLIGWLLLLVLVPLYLAVRRRRIASPTPATEDIIPSWQDMFSCAVVPVLFATVVAVGVRVSDSTGSKKEVAAATDVVPLAKRANVILVVADSLRAQSLSLYGHPDKTTPAIDRFAESSSTYLTMHANATTTIPSVLALLTGRHPLSHGRLNREFPPRPQPLNLLSLLNAHGYSIGAVTSNGDAFEAFAGVRPGLNITDELAFAFGFNMFSWLPRGGVYPTRFSGRMYDHLAEIVPFLAFSKRAPPEGNIRNTITRARNLISDLPSPFFLFVHIQEPHGPYELPKDFRLVHVNVDGSQLKVYAPFSPELQPVVDVYRGLYETTIKMIDSELGKFLEAAARINNNLVILTGDHGESFKRGYFLHGEELYENSTWVPLLIRYPGQKTGERVAGLTQSIDIAPTILDRVGIAKPDWMEGQSLKPGVLPASAETIAINFRHPYDGVLHYLPTKIAIWWGNYKLIAACQNGEAVLYDLRRDPQEQIDITEREPAIAEDLKRRIRTRLSRQSAEPRMSCPNL